MSKLNIFYEDISGFKISKNHIWKHLVNLIENENKKPGEISLIFCSDKYLLEMNKKHLNHDYFTDIITFDYVEDETISGDLFISIERVKENADNYNSVFKIELFRVIFHGVLHLIGYNDKIEEEKKQMREKEEYYLKEVDSGEVKV